jgi:peptidyl-dipeptidase Dcp
MVCQRRDLYEAIGAVAPSGPVEERLRADLLRRFEHHGAHLDEPARDRLTAINARLAELASDFAANMRAADATSGVATDDPTGLPDALVAAARDAAVERGLTGFYVPYSEQNAIVALEKAENHALREEMYWLTITRAADTNGPVVAEILALRHELAELLGYPGFVELHRDGRMVAEPHALLDELAAAYRP